MMKKILKIFPLLLACNIFIFPRPAKAVIPPDFIFNIGTQIAQFFSIIIIFLSAVFGALIQFFKLRFHAFKHKKILVAASFVIILIASLVLSYYYAIYKQKVEYQKWLLESQQFDVQQKSVQDVDSDNDGLTDVREREYGTDPDNPDSDGDSYEDGLEIGNGYDPTGSGKIQENQGMDENDLLSVEGELENSQQASSTQTIARKPESTSTPTSDANQPKTAATQADRFISKIELSTENAKFINEYYKNIAEGNFNQAYEMSKKSFNFDTFKGWYADTTKIILDKYMPIDTRRSSIELTLFEGNVFFRYGVSIELMLEKNSPTRIENSEVRILEQGIVSGNNVIADKQVIAKEYSFFEKNKSKGISLTNKDFKKIIGAKKNDYLVLDARENIEYENGYFPGSLHIRFADLKAGRWVELSKEKYIYVFCWSGIRGKEVAEYLRTKRLVASYLEKGANGWVEDGGKWVGNIKFAQKYEEDRYKKVFSTAEVKKMMQQGVILVDTREPYKFRKWHITKSYSIPIMYTPTINIETVFKQVPAKSKVITVCDGYVNCFDAKITGVELERRGHQFLGRYNKPWEYE